MVQFNSMGIHPSVLFSFASQSPCTKNCHQSGKCQLILTFFGTIHARKFTPSPPQSAENVPRIRRAANLRSLLLGLYPPPGTLPNQNYCNGATVAAQGEVIPELVE